MSAAVNAVEPGERLAMAADPARLFAYAAGGRCERWQSERLYSTAARQLWLTCRQVGKTETGSVKASHVAVFEPGSLVLVLAPTQRQADLFLARTRRTLTRLTRLTQVSTTSLTTEAGSQLVSLPGDNPDGIRGYANARLLIVDEGARVSDEAFVACLPMVGNDGQVLALSTPDARVGWFWEAWEDPGSEGRRRRSLPTSPRSGRPSGSSGRGGSCRRTGSAARWRRSSWAPSTACSHRTGWRRCSARPRRLWTGGGPMGEQFLHLHDPGCLQAGLDLAGLGQDHCALVVAERFAVYTGRRTRKWVNGRGLTECDETENRYLIRHITRWPTRMDPADVLAETADILAAPDLAGAGLWYDATGIGGGVRSVVRDLYMDGRFAHRPIPVTITGGETSQTPGTVPKLDLVTALSRLIHERRINVAACDLAPMLTRELDGFTARRTAAGNWTWAAASESIHDDLVTATMLACWRPMTHAQPRTVARAFYKDFILAGREDEPPTIVNGPRAGEVLS